MNYRMIINTIGRVLAAETALLLLPLLTAVIYQDSSASAFLITIIITAAASAGALLVKVRNRVIYAKEGFFDRCLCMAPSVHLRGAAILHQRRDTILY